MLPCTTVSWTSGRVVLRVVWSSTVSHTVVHLGTLNNCAVFINLYAIRKRVPDLTDPTKYPGKDDIGPLGKEFGPVSNWPRRVGVFL